ncbi:MAG TPA: serine/threonine-protein kinase [Gemmatimonadales bacterium]|nr:serine/threonine-protein kinase [Gemmatimonadales bacterium]
MSPGSQVPPLPERIGPFRVLQLLGEGGMGVVYEAEETGPVRRRVALKVVRAGLDSREIVSRFEAERQALAVMNHPGIARVLHAGTTEAGQPYFAMELVRGLPITQFCDTHRLSIPQRLELFIAVCHAVQHAHQKGVIHRDLKPSNVLVIDQDGTAQPKIIDFGIAKALGHQLTESTLVTLGGQTVGTAAYMSPEQADPAGMDVDTRADIYSLGVMLYELLVGQLPLEPGDVGVHLFLARLASGETNPPTPSVKLMAAQKRADLVAHARRTDTDHLRRDLRGDLDWIVMKAMDPDRARRYETANGLAHDLVRYLASEPVQARPPSARYRVSKFVQRHRAGVTAAGLIAAAIISGAVLATVGFVRATRAERVAAQEAAAAQQVTGFLVDLFRISNPDEARGNSLTAREILDRGARNVATGLSGQPLLQARLMHTLGTVYEALGLYGPARPLLEEALRVRERDLGPDDPSVAETLTALGDVARAKGDFGEADSAYRRALAIREAAFGFEHVEVATSLAALAALRVKQGRTTEAESLYAQVVPLDEKVRSPEDPRSLGNLRNLAVVYWNQGRYAEAEPLFRRVLALQERSLPLDHPDLAGSLNNLGGLHWMLGHYGDALGYYERARPIFEKTLGPSHPTVAGIYNNLGETYWKLQRYREAEPLFRRALAIKDSVLSPGHPSIAVTLNGLAGLLRDQGRFTEAEPLYRRALEIREALGRTSRETAETLRDYAELLRRAGRAGEAARLAERAAPPP